MKILSIGCGYQGSILAEELIRCLDIERLIICDHEKDRIEETAKKLGEKVFSRQLDMSNYSNLLEVMDDVDLVIGLSPGRLGYNVMKACVEKEVDLVDLSYMEEDPFTFHQAALEKGITIIPDCGVAPGLSNILIGRASKQFDKVEDVIIYVGGLPQKPRLPLDYKVTWCVEDLFEEYTRPSKIVRNGKTIEVEALTGLEEVDFQKLGKFEAFFTDGVRTLHHTINARNLWEKTMRYKGHAEKINFMRELGLFDKNELQRTKLSPWTFMCRFWEEKLSFLDEKDFVVMKIILTGTKDSTRLRQTFQMIDYFDEKRNITAMGRTTAYTALAVIKLLLEKKIENRGVFPPEVLGTDETLFNELMTFLEERHIKIIEKMEEL